MDFKTASRNGEPFEDMLKKYGLPNKAFPHCTRELKERPITAYVKSLGWKDWETAIGIRADEQHRIDRRRAYEEGRVYPLVDMMRVNSGFIRRFWEKQDFDLGLKDYEGNCDVCWKKSDRKLMTLYLENPERLAWWADMEKKYGGGEFTFFRDHKSAENIAANSKMPFDRVTDEHEASKKQFDFVLDQEEACTCKSTTIAGGITPLAQTPEQRTGA